jgi:tetratricopeptide (TPR) repeat protein
MNTKPVRIFISYSHENKIWLTQFLDPRKNETNPRYLLDFWERSLRGKGVEFWYDRDETAGIRGGDIWRTRIFEEIDSADIAILLITQDFVISPFIRDEELPHILNRSKEGKMEILPILLEPARLKDLEIASTFQITPGRPTPISEYFETSENDWKKVRLEVIEAIENVIERVLRKRGTPEPEHKPGPPKGPEAPPIPGSIPGLLNGYFFIVEKEDPYFIKYRDQEIPIVFKKFISKNNKANIWFDQAEKFYYNLKIEEATRFYKKTIEEDPEFIEAYLKLALISWLFQHNSNDAINYCQTGYNLNNTHTIGSFLIYLCIYNNKTEDAKSLLDSLINSKAIENNNQLAGLYMLKSILFNVLKDYDQEFDSIMTANQTAPCFGPALRHLSIIYLKKNEPDKAEALLQKAMDEYSKFIFSRNWLNTRDILINVYRQTGKNEMSLELLKENHHVQELLNLNTATPAFKTSILFEGEIDGVTHKGNLINGSGFNFKQAYLQDGIENNNNKLYEIEVNNSPVYCIFYDLCFGGTIVRIDSMSFIMKIVQDNNTATLIQINNGFKLSGIGNGFPNLWLVPENPSTKPINISSAKSFNLKRI